MWYYGRLPFASLYRLGNTWWYRIRRCVPSLPSVFLLLSCLCMLITSQMKAGIAAAAAPIGAALGQLAPVLSTVPPLWTWFGNTLVGKPLKKETSKNSTQLTGFIWSLTSSFFSFHNNDYHQIRWKTWLIWWNNTFCGWLLMKALFTVGALPPMCRYCHLVANKLLQKQLTSFHSFVGFTLAKILGLNLVSSAVVSLILQ